MEEGLSLSPPFPRVALKTTAPEMHCTTHHTPPPHHALSTIPPPPPLHPDLLQLEELRKPAEHGGEGSGSLVLETVSAASPHQAALNRQAHLVPACRPSPFCRLVCTPPRFSFPTLPWAPERSSSVRDQPFSAPLVIKEMQ